MPEDCHSMVQTEQEHSVNTDYGLRRGILSPMETLAQSVSTMAPTTTPAATIPLVCALAGNGTWLAYVLATVAVLLVARCIGRYARLSASPGSLYTYASMTLPPWLARPRRGVFCSLMWPRDRA
jgi:amino acid transporter